MLLQQNNLLIFLRFFSKSYFMYQFEIYRLFCTRYIDGGAELGRILNINEFLNHCKFLNHFNSE